MTNLINYITNELGYKVLRVSYFGSHQFNLDNEDSDIDLMCIVTRNKEYYTQLFEPNLSIPSKVIDGMDVQFLDIKKYLQLLSKSNFNAVSVIYNSVFTRPGYEYLFNINLLDININKVAHHALGLITNKTSGEQKLHMKAYFTLLLDFLLEYKHMPTSLHYDYLLSKSYSPIVESILTSKKNNTVFIYSDIWCNITHEDINEKLTNNSNNLINVCSEKWNKFYAEF